MTHEAHPVIRVQRSAGSGLFTVAGGRIVEIAVIADPEKLRGLILD